MSFWVNFLQISQSQLQSLPMTPASSDANKSLIQYKLLLFRAWSCKIKKIITKRYKIDSIENCNHNIGKTKTKKI